MNILNAVLIIGFYQTLILGGIVLTKKQKALSDYFLAGMFIAYGLTLFLGYMEIYNRENGYPYPFLINTSTPLIFLHGPLMWFYIKSITEQHFRFKPKYLLHFAPFVVVVVMLSISMYRLPGHEKVLMESSEAFRKQISFPVIIALVAIFTQGYFLWGLWLIGNYKKRIENYFSEISTIDLTWLRILLITCVVFYAGTSLLYITDYIFNVFSYNLLQGIGYSYQSVFILVLGYRGYKQGNVFTNKQVTFDLDAVIPQEPEGYALTDRDKTFVEHLTGFMEAEKPYLKPELTLATLANMLKVNPDYLSGILNGKLNKNFFDFVNYYRIQEFKRISRKEKNSNITIMGMAWDAGFNSKATFNRVFKKATGRTPGEYVQSVR